MNGKASFVVCWLHLLVPLKQISNFICGVLALSCGVLALSSGMPGVVQPVYPYLDYRNDDNFNGAHSVAAFRSPWNF